VKRGVAADVAKVLDYSQTQNLLTVLDDDEKADHALSMTSSNGTSQERLYAIISESGLYHAIFKSHKPEAILFRKWVTSEVLPAGSW
jgi:prophage antirepressor-like protein